MDDSYNFDQMPFGDAEFAENPEPRCACVLVVDTSGSMAGERISGLNAGVVAFAEALRLDSLAAKRVDVAVVSFGGNVQVVSEFASAAAFQPRPLQASGGTPMGEAIITSTDLLVQRQSEYRRNGIPTYRPWIFLITDGEPTDKWEKAAQRIREGDERKSFSFFAVGVDGADMNCLAQISVNAPVMLRGLAFADMFRWLSSSLSAVSRSSVGQAVHPINPAGPAGWATII